MRDSASDKNRTTDLGTVRINNDVITTIASIAATEVKGVHRMGGRIGKNLYDMLLKRSSAKGVEINTTEGDIRISVYIVVDYGTDIPRVADEVQDNVKKTVERMTGLSLAEVNVIVEGVACKARSKE